MNAAVLLAVFVGLYFAVPGSLFVPRSVGYATLALDHANVQVERSRYAAMRVWYEKVLRLHPGPRPDFGVDGTWFYASQAARAVVHLVVRPDGMLRAPRDPRLPVLTRSENLSPEQQRLVAPQPRLDHFCMQGSGYADFLKHLHAIGENYLRTDVPDVPGEPKRAQINLRDPDGNLVEVLFAGEDFD